MPTLDHVLLATADLSESVARCRALGFSVAFGGREKSALNALIFLLDGTLIELIGKDRFPRVLGMLRRLSVTRWRGPMTDRIAAFRDVPSGPFNLSFHSADLDGTYRGLRTAGIRAGRPERFTRRREDGVRVSWSLVGTDPYDLPFFIGDYSPGRVGNRASALHHNGASGLSGVTIDCRDAAAYADLYGRLLVSKPLETVAGNAPAFLIEVGRCAIRLVEGANFVSAFSPSDGSRLRSADVLYRTDDETRTEPFPAEAVCI